MSSRIKDRLKLWNLPRDIWRQLARVQGRTIVPPYGCDSADGCLLGSDYWNNYPIRDYKYIYNSWGFRSSQDYESLQGQEINLCIGDSVTVNMGGPVEHSWPSLLAKKFTIPTLNFGIDALCYYHYPDIVAKVRDYFKIRHIFVLYNLLEKSERVGNLLNPPNIDLDIKINSLKNNFWVIGSIDAFVPPWSFHPEELPTLYRHFPGCHDYLKHVKFDYTTIDPAAVIHNAAMKEKYQTLSGARWPMFERWAETVVSGVDPFVEFNHPRDRLLISQILYEFLHPYILKNRDGFHMSQISNQALADYFYQKSQGVK